MFKSAKIKLTAWYLAILMVITLGFSSVVYFAVTSIATRALTSQSIRFENEFKDCVIIQQPKRFGGKADIIALEEIQEKTFNILVWVNLSIFVTAGILGYVLAGETLKPIEEMMEKQKRFVSDAAHELKTPITAIKTDFEVTLRAKKPELSELKDAIKRGLEEIQHLSLLTEKLLKQSKYTYIKNSVVDPEKIELHSFIAELVEKQKSLNKRENIFISEKTQDYNVRGNKNELKESFSNILENAIKYSPSDKDINVNISRSSHSVIVAIKDHGIGISEQDLKHIFEPFFRSDNSRTDSNKNGYGLGLAIVKEIIEKHQGKITVKSTQNEGSEFTILLPQA